ncbi:PREDICTED: protein YLS9-like [Fragaria vesca subsp. vesca]|uniref:protein YLS9-like n=1 Tax=Fragaria vesca subsp. vesca TaxID=101020 RepID=UPI0002C2EA89|nr:PREDICTED: protein YLS9-like [Fragaria vesca subsp. vesca]
MSVCCCECCQLLLVIAAMFGFFYLFFYLSSDPYNPSISITHASLKEFKFTADSHTLRYDLDLNIIARNPNVNYDVHYDDVQVKAYWSPQTTTYDGRRLTVKKLFAVANMNYSFWQGKGEETALPPLCFKGNQLMLSGDEVVDHSSMLMTTHANSNPSLLATADGHVYEIFVEVFFINKLHRSKSTDSWEGSLIRSRVYKSGFSCDLLVPLIDKSQSAGASSIPFRTVQC